MSTDDSPSLAGQDRTGALQEPKSLWSRWGQFWLRHPNWLSLVTGALVGARLLSSGASALVAAVVSVVAAVVQAILYARLLSQVRGRRAR